MMIAVLMLCLLSLVIIAIGHSSSNSNSNSNSNKHYGYEYDEKNDYDYYEQEYEYGYGFNDDNYIDNNERLSSIPKLPSIHNLGDEYKAKDHLKTIPSIGGDPISINSPISSIAFNDDDIDLYPLDRWRRRGMFRRPTKFELQEDSNNDKNKNKMNKDKGRDDINNNNKNSTSNRKKSTKENTLQDTKPPLVSKKLPVDTKQVQRVLVTVGNQVRTKSVSISKVTLKVAIVYVSVLMIRWLFVNTSSFIKDNRKMIRRKVNKTRSWLLGKVYQSWSLVLKWSTKYFTFFKKEANRDNNGDDNSNNDDISIIKQYRDDIEEKSDYRKQGEHDSNQNTPSKNFDYSKLEKEQEEIWQSLGYLLNSTKVNADDINKRLNELNEKQQASSAKLNDAITMIENKNKVFLNSMIDATFDELQNIRSELDTKLNSLKQDIDKILNNQTINEAKTIEQLKSFVNEIKNISIKK